MILSSFSWCFFRLYSLLLIVSVFHQLQKYKIIAYKVCSDLKNGRVVNKDKVRSVLRGNLCSLLTRAHLKNMCFSAAKCKVIRIRIGI